jgi:adenosylcobyric acid synthase
LIVLEGAGSPAEINLKAHDLVNMRMAHHADAAVVLAADIERGGVFAQLVGTWELLDAAERRRVVGFVINKFRGDAGLLRSGLDYVEQRTGRPVLGVLPYDEAVQLDEEDSLGVSATATSGEIDVAIVRLPGLSNFTDFASLARAPGVGVRYVSEPDQLRHPDLVVLPGTRTTVRSLEWLRATGLAAALLRMAGEPEGPYLLGICGGCQLLGRDIHDPQGVEARESNEEGLGLLDLDTHFGPHKTLCRVEATVIAGGSLGAECPVIGYEVHQGTSRRRDGAQAWLHLRRQTGERVEDGAVSRNGRIFGTYVHGLFDDARFCRAVVTTLRQRRGLPALAETEWLSQREFWARRYARLGEWLAEHCDLRPVAKALGLSP